MLSNTWTNTKKKDYKNFWDSETGVELEVQEKESLVERFANNYKSFGCKLEFVTDRSSEETEFVNDFGGIGFICVKT